MAGRDGRDSVRERKRRDGNSALATGIVPASSPIVGYYDDRDDARAAAGIRTREVAAVPVPAKVRQMARECLAVRVRLLNRLVTAACDEELRPHGVRVAQVNVLCAVANAGPVTPTDLAATLVMDKSTLSRDVEKLIARGWVETAAGDDARSHTLTATAAGVAFLEEIHPHWLKTQKRLAAQLGPVFVASLSATVDQIWADEG